MPTDEMTIIVIFEKLAPSQQAIPTLNQALDEFDAFLMPSCDVQRPA